MIAIKLNPPQPPTPPAGAGAPRHRGTDSSGRGFKFIKCNLSFIKLEKRQNFKFIKGPAVTA